MATIEERAWEKYPEVIKHHNLAQIDINEEKRRMYIEISTEQKAIDDAKYKELINELLGELYTSRAYHLGITGLDSDEERARKERDGDCALIREIDGTIKYVQEAMKE